MSIQNDFPNPTDILAAAMREVARQITTGQKISVHVKLTGRVGNFGYELEAWPSALLDEGSDVMVMQSDLMNRAWNELWGEMVSAEQQLEEFIANRREVLGLGVEYVPPVGETTTTARTTSAPPPTQSRQTRPTSDRSVSRDWGLLTKSPRVTLCNYGDQFTVIAREYIFPNSDGNLEFFGSTNDSSVAGIRPNSPLWNSVFESIMGVENWRPTEAANRRRPFSGEFAILIQCSVPDENGRGITSQGNPYQNVVRATPIERTSYNTQNAVNPDNARPIPLIES